MDAPRISFAVLSKFFSRCFIIVAIEIAEAGLRLAIGRGGEDEGKGDVSL
jgi:hypothetical protein